MILNTDMKTFKNKREMDAVLDFCCDNGIGIKWINSTLEYEITDSRLKKPDIEALATELKDAVIYSRVATPFMVEKANALSDALNANPTP